MIESVMASSSVRALISLATAALLAISCVPYAHGARREAPRAVQGVLDLSDWDFGRDGPVGLAGEWDFQPGRLLSGTEAMGSEATRIVPDFWHGADAGGTAGRGVGTYHLLVLLGARNVDLGMRVPTVSTAFELDVNGVTIAHAGRPAVLAADAIPACFTGVCRVPASVAQQGAASPRSLDIVVRVSNHEYRTGGMWAAFILGREEALSADKRRDDGMMLCFFGAAFATAVGFFLIFSYRRRERDNLWFAFFVTVIALRALVTGDYLLAAILPWLPFGALIRLTYLSAFASFPLCVLFYGNLFPEEIPLRMRKLACAPFLLISLTLAAPLPILTRSIYVLYPLLVIVMALTIILGVGRAALHHRPGSVSLFVMSVLLSAAGIADMLSSSLKIHETNMLFPALAVFIFMQAVILAKRFTAAFDSVERLSGELTRVNEGLDRQVRERTRELEGAYTRIKELSVKDPLTDVFNRRYLDQELVREIERALRYGLPLSLLFCDFDHFKEINDRYGHGAGDDVLRAFSRIVSETIRGNVDWCARYGGEEFLIVAPGTRPGDAARLAERLRSRAESEAVESEARSVAYTLSIGVAGLESPDPASASSDAEAIAMKLVSKADAALYAAKTGGRNRVELMQS